MWKKKEPESPPPQPVTTPPVVPPAPRPSPSPRRTERAIIGPTLKIDGEISGEEDLLVQGQIAGKIVVKGQSVTIGKAGKVQADIHARSVRVEGTVRGDLYGEQDVVIEASGNVEGNLIAPSVRLENGSRFKGSIDMEATAPPTPKPAVPPTAAPASSPQREKAPPPRPGQPPRKI